MRFPYSGNGTWTPDYHSGLIDAVKRFLMGYMEFGGRYSRREFWLAMLFFILGSEFFINYRIILRGGKEGAK